MPTLVSMLVSEFITIVEALLPYLMGGSASAQVVTTILNSLLQIMPQLSTLGPELMAIVQNVINAIRSTGNLTAEQMDQLDAMDAQVNAAFEAAATAAGVDPAA